MYAMPVIERSSETGGAAWQVKQCFETQMIVSQHVLQVCHESWKSGRRYGGDKTCRMRHNIAIVADSIVTVV